jgi:lysophospholipase L1-like esterase
MPKQIREIIQEIGGKTTVEYDDNSLVQFNIADTVTGKVDPLTGRITLTGASNGDSVLASVGQMPVSTTTIGVVGDSMVQDGYSNTIDGTSNVGSSSSYVNWAAAYSKGRLRYVAACATGGWAVDDILSNIDARLSPVPDYTLVEVGFNNISGISDNPDASGVVAAFQVKLRTLIQKVRNKGSIPILQTISPKNSTMSGFTTVQQKHIYKHNSWVREYARQNQLMMFDYANYVSNPTDLTNGGIYQTLTQTAHVHAGNELNRALGYELWAMLGAVIGGSSPVANFGGLSFIDNTLISTGLNMIANPFLAQTVAGLSAGSTSGTLSSGTLPAGCTAAGGASSNAVFSLVASTEKALSTANLSGESGTGLGGNWAQCSIDTSIAGNLYATNVGPGFSFPINFSYGGVLTYPLKLKIRVRVKATALANCAGIFVRLIGGGGGYLLMSPMGNGITPAVDAKNNVLTPFDVVYESEPLTMPSGWGKAANLNIMAAITQTAAGTTTFQCSQPELYFVPL